MIPGLLVRLPSYRTERRGLRTKDAERFVACYDPDVVKFDLAPPLAETGPDVLYPSGWNAWFDTWLGPIDLEITQLEATLGEGIAFCHSLNRMAGTKAVGGEVELWFRSTLGLRRSGESWKICHEHNSTPFYMDGSEQAALDLTP
jgi:ketosteroid isomerase-like protein